MDILKARCFSIAAISYSLLFFGCGKSENSKPKDTDKEKKYELIWSDEFDGTKLDTDKWNYETGTGFGNQEKQYCTDREKNVKVEDGNLVITAYKEDYNNCSYTSARINSKKKGFLKYGKIEARISLPSGKGTWPAFWMLPEVGYWPTYGEIDIMEHVGSDPTMISHAVHTAQKNGSNGQNWQNKQYPGVVEGEFHTYAIEWLNDYDDGDDCIIFYIDDKESTRLYQPHNINDLAVWPFTADFYVILNLSIGGTWGGQIDDSIFNNPAKPVQMKVDYVRLYQKK
ncbi:glycoside hydrolase family 16 protein (plasmid) [Pedobacter sp. BS3]|uniref:glycoside hydrolase family 16 protein n=1 Tax=Pedobacter sp. BS3 TaxID=2567937 RepID=UPI0011EDBCB0|nr:glycoside hydrolase family 16 protein [Pedobacter sp. BS3]TZF86005.1 glycoside hydrolase family 16 protein [Pedobacter sp. BS3]